MPKSTPVQFDVPDADCQACVNSITQAVHRVDPNAQVTVDLDTKRVVIGGEGESHEFMQAVQEAGFDVKAAA